MLQLREIADRGDVLEASDLPELEVAEPSDMGRLTGLVVWRGPGIEPWPVTAAS